MTDDKPRTLTSTLLEFWKQLRSPTMTDPKHPISEESQTRYWELREFVSNFHSILRWAMLISTLCLVWVLFLGWRIGAGETMPSPWNLLLIAIGALSAGGLVGFIYGSFSAQESTRFAPVFTLLSGILSGVGIVDLTKQESAISGALHLLASNCGLGALGGGVVAFVIAAFFPIGFMLMYVQKSLFLGNLPGNSTAGPSVSAEVANALFDLVLTYKAIPADPAEKAKNLKTFKTLISYDPKARTRILEAIKVGNPLVAWKEDKDLKDLLELLKDKS